MHLNKVSYWLDNNTSDIGIRMFLKLLDILDIHNNIAIILSRLPTNIREFLEQFSQATSGSIVFDTTRDDHCVLFVKNLDNSLLLYDLIYKLDEQTELSIIPILTDFMTFLFNCNYVENKNAIYCNVSSVQICYDGDYGLHVYWDSDSKNFSNMFLGLEYWEQMLNCEHCKYKKHIKN